METRFLKRKRFYFGNKIIKTKKDFYSETGFLNLKLRFLIIHPLMALLGHRSPELLFKEEFVKNFEKSARKSHGWSLFF